MSRTAWDWIEVASWTVLASGLALGAADDRATIYAFGAFICGVKVGVVIAENWRRGRARD